jgi:hypothetical protein
MTCPGVAFAGLAILGVVLSTMDCARSRILSENEIPELLGTYTISAESWLDVLKPSNFPRRDSQLELLPDGVARVSELPLLWTFGFGPIDRSFSCSCKWRTEGSATWIKAIVLTLPRKQCGLGEAMLVRGSSAQVVRFTPSKVNNRISLSTVLIPELDPIEFVRLEAVNK